MPFVISTIDDDPSLLDRFLALPSQIYDSSATLTEQTRWQISEANPFFRYGSAKHFLTLDGGRAVARCSAILNRRLAATGEAIGLIGFFESIDDEAAAHSCLRAATSWLQAQGTRVVWGPMQFSIWHGYRLMTRGFEHPSFLGEPRNPSYYPRLFESFGFSPLARWRSWDLSRAALKQIVDSANSTAPELQASGFRAVPFDPNQFQESLGDLHHLADVGFRDNIAYSSVDFDEFEAIFNRMRPLIFPDLVLIVRDRTDAPHGFVYCYPDPQCGVVLHTMVLLPSIRGKGGVGALVTNTALKAALQRGGERTVGALAKEGRTLYDKVGEATREYALYQLELPL
jgi:hypothetical protein